MGLSSTDADTDAFLDYLGDGSQNVGIPLGIAEVPEFNSTAFSTTDVDMISDSERVEIEVSDSEMDEFLVADEDELSEEELKHHPEMDKDADFLKCLPFLRGIDPFDKTVEQEEPEWYVENRDITNPPPPLDDTAEVPPAVKFLKDLISLELDDLDQEDQKCGICMEPYLTGDDWEMPLALPCGHVFGNNCLHNWLSEFSNKQHDNCPVCRKQHIEETRAHIGTIKGLTQRLRDVNYLLTAAGPLRLDAEGRRDWEAVKEYVNNFLEEEKEKREAWSVEHGRFVTALQQEIADSPDLREYYGTEEELRELQEQILGELVRHGVGPDGVFEADDDEDGGSNDDEDETNEDHGVADDSVWYENCQWWHPPPTYVVTDPAPTHRMTQVGGERSRPLLSPIVTAGYADQQAAIEAGGSHVFCQICKIWHSEPTHDERHLLEAMDHDEVNDER